MFFCDLGQPYNCEEHYSLYTIQDLFDGYQKFVDDGANGKKQKLFQNFINEPLLAGDPETLVLLLLMIPELHLLIGVVDKLLLELEKAISREWVDTYLKKVSIVRKSYQGQHSTHW